METDSPTLDSIPAVTAALCPHEQACAAIACASCQTAGVEDPLQVRMYGERLGDYQLISGWWQARHGSPLMETLLPPLGIIVERSGAPLGALWCYECIGIGVCFLEYPVTRPGMALVEARAVMSLAIEACIAAAKAHGDYSLFRCSTLPAIGRMLGSLGWVREHGGERANYALRRD